MDPGIFPWAPLQDAVSSAPPANVPIPRAPPWPAADPSATVTSPIRMDPLQGSPTQMKAPPVATTLQAQSESLPPRPAPSLDLPLSREPFQLPALTVEAPVRRVQGVLPKPVRFHPLQVKAPPCPSLQPLLGLSHRHLLCRQPPVLPYPCLSQSHQQRVFRPP